MSQSETRLDAKLIGEKLMELRTKKGETQKEVADAIGVAPSTYSMYENGERIPRDGIKVTLASHFKTTVHKLFFVHRVTKSDT